MRRDAAVAQEASVELALAPAPAPRVIRVTDRGRHAAAGEHAGDADPRPVEQLDQLPDFPGEHGERAQVPAAHARDRTACRRALGVDLERECQLVFLGDVACAADQVQIGDELLGRLIEARVRALGLEQVVAELISVPGERALDPGDAAHGGVIARQRGEHRAVVGQALLALGRPQQRERAAPHAQRGGERARPEILDGTEAGVVVLHELRPRGTRGPPARPGATTARWAAEGQAPRWAARRRGRAARAGSGKRAREL